MKRTAILTFFILTLTLISCEEEPVEETGWKEVSFYWNSPYAFDVEMLSPTNMIAACTDGRIVYLTDDPTDYKVDWMDEAPMISEGDGTYQLADFYNAYSVNNNIWVAGNASIFGSFDGGENWITMLEDHDYNILSLYFENDLHGWAVGKSFSFEQATIFETVNGGANWDIIYRYPKGVEDSWSIFRDIYEVNGSIWIIGDGYEGNDVWVKYVLKSDDGGRSWDNIDAALEQINHQIFCIQFADGMHGWIGGYKELIITTDGGLTWSNIALEEAGSISDFIFLNNDEGWIGADNGVFHTTDGGFSWEKQYLPGFDESNYAIYGIDFIDEMNGVAAGANGGFYITTSGGE
jgi:photosystem II stability/assembly factor-like uncharacterized protein